MASTEVDLSGCTPTQVDTFLEETYTQLERVRRNLDYHRRVAARAGSVSQSTQESIDRALADVAELERSARHYEEEFTRRGGWTRAFLVVSSTGGHVHSSTHCHTCRPSTRFVWLPEYSGAEQDQIIADAGERACTSCYPDAPVDVLQRPTKIFSRQEKEAAAEREARAADKAARDAKVKAAAITAPDGSALRIPSHGVVKTERTAQMLYVERAAELLAEQQGLLGGYRALYREEIEPLLAALAHKRNQDVETTRAELDPKVQARVKRDYR